MKMNPFENNQNNMNPPMNIEMFKKFLPKISDQEINQMQQMASQMGMNQQQIEAGMNFLRQFR